MNDIETPVFYRLSERAILTLENLIKTGQIDFPVTIDTLLDISIGTLVDLELNDDLKIIDVFSENPVLIYDKISFEDSGEYSLHDILSQIICFRLIYLMHDFLQERQIEFQEIEEETEVETNSD